MTAIYQKNLFAAVFAGALSIATAQGQQQLPTNGIVNSPAGKLIFKNGYPTDATVLKLFDEIDFQRASQTYLWSLPLMAMHQWQNEQRDKFGAGNLDYVDYFTFTDKLGLLTANATTPYIMAFPNLKESGPLVMEVPPGATAGGVGPVARAFLVIGGATASGSSPTAAVTVTDRKSVV